MKAIDIKATEQSIDACVVHSGLSYTNIFGFENLKELSSQDDMETRIRVFAINKDTGIPQNYLIKIANKDLADRALMSRLKEEIKRSFVGVIEGEPK